MVADSYRGRRISSFVHVSHSCYFSFLPLRSLRSQRQKDKWLPVTRTSSRLWKAAAERCGDSSPSSPAEVPYHLPGTLDFLICLLQPPGWQQVNVHLSTGAKLDLVFLQVSWSSSDREVIPLCLLCIFLCLVLFSVLGVRKWGICSNSGVILLCENMSFKNIRIFANARAVCEGQQKVLGKLKFQGPTSWSHSNVWSCNVCLFGFLFSAPEVLAQKPYSKAVDCWSIGVIAYILWVSVGFSMQAAWGPATYSPTI